MIEILANYDDTYGVIFFGNGSNILRSIWKILDAVALYFCYYLSFKHG